MYTKTEYKNTKSIYLTNYFVYNVFRGEIMEKEKTIATSIRIKESTKKQLEEMATFLGVSCNKLIATTIEIGMIFANSQIKKENGEKNELQ